MSSVDTLGSIGEGLSKSMGNLMEAASASRQANKEALALNSPENQYKQAVSAQALKDFQMRQQKVRKEDLINSNPYAPHLIEAAKAEGLIMGDEQEFTRGQIMDAQKHFMDNPRVLASIIDKTYTNNLQQDQEYEAAIGKKKNDLAQLISAPGDKVLNAGKIEKLQGEISDLEKQREPFSKGRMQDSTLRDQLKIMIAAQDYDKLPPEDKVVYNALKEQGIEPTNENILKKKQELKSQQKTGEQTDHYTIQKGDEVKSVRLKPGQSIPKGWTIVSNSSFNQNITGEQSKTLAESMADGKLSPSAITKRGKSQAAVYSEVKQLYPNFDFSKAEANYRYMNDKSNLKIMGQVKAVKPRVEKLEKLVDELNNVNPNLANMAVNSVSKQLGKSRVTNYESLRNAIIQEVNTALAGSSVPSDYRIKLELEQLGSERSPAQLKGAIRNLLGALDARMDASVAVPFPWDDVKGIKGTKTETAKTDPLGLR